MHFEIECIQTPMVREHDEYILALWSSIVLIYTLYKLKFAGSIVVDDGAQTSTDTALLVWRGSW